MLKFLKTLLRAPFYTMHRKVLQRKWSWCMMDDFIKYLFLPPIRCWPPPWCLRGAHKKDIEPIGGICTMQVNPPFFFWKVSTFFYVTPYYKCSFYLSCSTIGIFADLTIKFRGDFRIFSVRVQISNNGISMNSKI